MLYNLLMSLFCLHPTPLSTFCETGALTGLKLTSQVRLAQQEPPRILPSPLPHAGIISTHDHAWYFNVGLGGHTQDLMLASTSLPQPSPFVLWFVSSSWFSNFCVFDVPSLSGAYLTTALLLCFCSSGLSERMRCWGYCLINGLEAS